MLRFAVWALPTHLFYSKPCFTKKWLPLIKIFQASSSSWNPQNSPNFGELGNPPLLEKLSKVFILKPKPTISESQQSGHWQSPTKNTGKRSMMRIPKGPWVKLWFLLSSHYCWWKKSDSPPFGCKKTLWIMGFPLPFPQLVIQISEPSTVLPGLGMPHPGFHVESFPRWKLWYKPPLVPSPLWDSSHQCDQDLTLGVSRLGSNGFFVKKPKHGKLSCGFNQPIWKICSSNWESFPPGIRVNITNLWVATN